MPSNLRNSFSNTFWSYWAMCPSKYSPPHFIHRSHRFFQFWKHSWNACFGILLSSASEFSLSPRQDSNRRLFRTDFSMVKRKKATGARSDYDEGWGTSVVSCLVRKSRIRREECAGALSWRNHFSPPQIRPFSPHCLSAFTSPWDNIPVHRLATR